MIYGRRRDGRREEDERSDGKEIRGEMGKIRRKEVTKKDWVRNEGSWRQKMKIEGRTEKRNK